MQVVTLAVRWVLLVADTVAVGPRTAAWGCTRVLTQPPVVAVQCPVTVTQDSLRRVPGVQSVELDRLEDAPQAVDVPVTWGVQRIRVDSAWNRGLTGAGVVVGVLDSGIDPTHPQYEGRVRGFNVTTTDTLAFSETPGCNGHGTHVTGTTVARDYGVAPGATAISVRVFENINGECRAWSSTQVAGLRALESRGAAVVNVSIGGTSYITSYAYAIEQYRLAGGVFVGAAGNAGSAPPRYPGGYPAAVTVGSVGWSDTRSGFSSYGAKLDVMAPGEGVESTMPGGGIGGKSGTSMAAPHVAGFVALIRQRLPSVSADSVIAILRAATADLGTPGCDADTGCGRIDGMRLVQLLIPRAPVALPRPCVAGQPCCAPVLGIAGPWTATTTHPTARVWTTATSVCWQSDVPGPLTIRLRSL